MMRLVDPPRLVAITDTTLVPARELVGRLERLASSARPGSVALLLRDHQLSGLARLELGRALRAVAARHAQALWVADRLDLALLLGADVLHLGEASVSARDARRALPDAVGICRAWHEVTPSAQQQDELDAVDALLVSPVLAPRKGRDALGLEALGAWGEQLRARHQASPPKMYALGGVTAESAASCIAVGATGVAAIGAALASEPSALLKALRIGR
jgi:thiamine-phosphate pyrophosphorylase